MCLPPFVGHPTLRGIDDTMEFVKKLCFLLSNGMSPKLSSSPLFKTLLTIEDGKYEPVHKVLNEVFTGLTLLDVDKRMSVHEARVKVQCIKPFLPTIGEDYECPSIEAIIREQRKKYGGSVGTIEGMRCGVAGVEHEEGWDQNSLNPVHISEIKSLVLHQGEFTTSRKGQYYPQVVVSGGSARNESHHVKTIMCKNIGYDGRTVNWECKTTLPNSLDIGQYQVVCEGWNGPGDDYVVPGSCNVEIELNWNNSTHYDSDYDYEEEEYGDPSIFEFFLGLGVTILAIYLLIKCCRAVKRRAQRPYPRPGPAPVSIHPQDPSVDPSAPYIPPEEHIHGQYPNPRSTPDIMESERQRREAEREVRERERDRAERRREMKERERDRKEFRREVRDSHRGWNWFSWFRPQPKPTVVIVKEAPKPKKSWFSSSSKPTKHSSSSHSSSSSHHSSPSHENTHTSVGYSTTATR
ncbi:Store-operated calcium entry-associated regulatory factor like protein [Aduncisulcus paluster]|uniref:Store-operated calcium entry-associated regulatory factor n=1 Tax=Aduncisulcus paluster TaxID=2918883 RepID=A0ABQ5KRP2_9EUKA|nr:Store-operated calcium entry-associated regulatory factor like protein [Aduncisulcus paluster]